MKILPEYFDPAQFTVPNYENHFILKRPYTDFASTMDVKFEDYNTNLKLQCVIFDKIWQTCENTYGLIKAKRNARCFEALNYFHQCREINDFFAKDKKYFPQRYSTSDYQWVEPHHDFVHVEPSVHERK